MKTQAKLISLGLVFLCFTLMLLPTIPAPVQVSELPNTTTKTAAVTTYTIDTFNYAAPLNVSKWTKVGGTTCSANGTHAIISAGNIAEISIETFLFRTVNFTNVYYTGYATEEALEGKSSHIFGFGTADLHNFLIIQVFDNGSVECQASADEITLTHDPAITLTNKTAYNFAILWRYDSVIFYKGTTTLWSLTNLTLIPSVDLSVAVLGGLTGASDVNLTLAINSVSISNIVAGGEVEPEIPYQDAVGDAVPNEDIVNVSMWSDNVNLNFEVVLAGYFNESCYGTNDGLIINALVSVSNDTGSDEDDQFNIPVDYAIGLVALDGEIYVDFTDYVNDSNSAGESALAYWSKSDDNTTVTFGYAMQTYTEGVGYLNVTYEQYLNIQFFVAYWNAGSDYAPDQHGGYLTYHTEDYVYTAPSIIDVDPANESTGVSINPTISFTAIDIDDELMNITIYNCTDDSVLYEDTLIENGTLIELELTDLLYSTVYGWYVVIITDNEEFTGNYTFTTMTEPTDWVGLFVFTMQVLSIAVGSIILIFSVYQFIAGKFVDPKTIGWFLLGLLLFILGML